MHNNNNYLFRRLSLSLLVSLFPFSAMSAEWFADKQANSVTEAFSEGHKTLDFRLRYEDVKQGRQGAQALTLRSRLAFETLPYELLSVFVEFDDVQAIPNDDNYFSGANGQRDDVFLEDPEGTELNQAWVAYDIANTLIKFGRQTVELNNQRIIGGDSWRQNEQTFTGLSIRNEMLNYTQIEFAQFNAVQTNQDKALKRAHQDINAKLFNVNYRGFWLSDLSLYALWISDHPDQKQWETSTYGMRFSGDLGGEFSVKYQLDLAKQSDAGNNAAEYTAYYSLIDLVFGYCGLEANVGYERLGASKNGYFVSPLGSLHEFQGASDAFNNNGLGNVQSGIRDRYIGVGYASELEFGKHPLSISTGIHYHDFDADSEQNNMRHLGEEWRLLSGIEIENYQILIGYADYHADHYGQDDQHAWLAFTASF